MHGLPKIRIVSETGTTVIFLNGKQVDYLQKFMVYQTAGDPHPTVVVTFAADVEIDADVPTLYIDRKLEDAVQQQAGTSSPEGEEMAGSER